MRYFRKRAMTPPPLPHSPAPPATPVTDSKNAVLSTPPPPPPPTPVPCTLMWQLKHPPKCSVILGGGGGRVVGQVLYLPGRPKYLGRLWYFPANMFAHRLQYFPANMFTRRLYFPANVFTLRLLYFPATEEEEWHKYSATKDYLLYIKA